MTKGLDPDVPMKDSGIPWIGEIPAHWEVKKLKYVCKVESGHTPNRSKLEYWLDDECVIPWVSLNDTATLARADEIYETAYRISSRGMLNSSAHLIDKGAVVFTRDATVGLAAILGVEAAVSQHVIAWVCGSRMFNRYLLRVVDAMRGELDRLTFGATIQTIGMRDIRQLVSPVPPIEEQRSVSIYVKKQLDSLARIRGLYSKQIDRLKEYRQALITQAVTGQIAIPAPKA